MKRRRPAGGHCGHPGETYGSLDQAGSSGSVAKSRELDEIYWLPWQRKNDRQNNILAPKTFHLEVTR